MRLDQLVLRSLSQHRSSSLLMLLNVAFGAALVSLVLLLRHGAAETFLAPSRGYALVVGAPGSRLELVLDTVFHKGESPGLLGYEVFQELANDDSVELAVPYAVGDAFRGYRVIGTSGAFFHARFPYPRGRDAAEKLASGRAFRFDAGALRERLGEIEAGRAPASSGEPRVREAVVGARVARELDLRVGDQIEPTHGVTGGSAHRDEQLWQVVGIAKETGTPIDDVVLINLDSFFYIEDHAGGVIPETGKAGISAVVLFPRPGVHKALLAARLGKRTDLQVADVDVEVQRLLGILGGVDRILFVVAVLVVILGVSSVAVAILNTLGARRREIAILRILGARRRTIFGLVGGEATLLCAVGGALGMALAHLLLAMGAEFVERLSGVRPPVAVVLPEEVLGYLAVVAAGALAGLLPALAAYRTDVAANVTPEA